MISMGEDEIRFGCVNAIERVSESPGDDGAVATFAACDRGDGLAALVDGVHHLAPGVVEFAGPFENVLDGPTSSRARGW